MNSAEVAAGYTFLNRAPKSDFIQIYHDWLLQNIQRLNWIFFMGNSDYPFFTSDNPFCSHLRPENANNINIFNEFLCQDLRLSLPLSSKVCWVAQALPGSPMISKVNVDEDWWKCLNEQRAKWSKKYIYASTNNDDILNLGRKYLDINAFDVL